MDSQTLVDYAKSLDCIHCGLCLNTCPTYKLTGVESSSPRGRIHMMRALAEGQLAADADFVEEMDFCLLCRNCESVCPSGVHFGAMMETTRAGLARTVSFPWTTRCLRWLGFRVVLPHRAALRAVATLGRFAQRSGLLASFAKLLGARGTALLSAPAIPEGSERRLLPERTPARGERSGSVAVLEGCVMPELFGRVNRATVAVLSAAGFESRCARGATCCGSLHAHNGDLEGARKLARTLITEFDQLGDEQGAPLDVVVNSAGCSAHMKDYGVLLADDPAWRERALRFAARVRDLTEFLASENGRRGLARAASARAQATDKLKSDGDLEPLAYDDPCHLCHGQGIRAQPRLLLDQFAGFERVELRDSELCCGSAGIYALLRPADSAAIFQPKLDALIASGARTLVTANPGCQMQWETGIARAGLDVRVLHIAEVLEIALGA